MKLAQVTAAAGPAIMMLALCVPAAHPQSTPGAATRTIQVSGHGEAHAVPDLASLNLAIETHAVTAQECAGLNADLAQKVVEALMRKLKDKGRVWTGGYSLYPEYNAAEYRESAKPGKPSIIGYRAENSITVETGAIGLLGSLIDAAIAAGANRINYLNFELKDDTKARQEAIALASKDAQVQAQALAASLSVKLRRVMSASTTAEVRPIPVARPIMAMAAGAETPVQANQVTVPATVSLVYEIE